MLNNIQDGYVIIGMDLRNMDSQYGSSSSFEIRKVICEDTKNVMKETRTAPRVLLLLYYCYY